MDHPSDPGGATNHGVSLRWLRGLGLDTGDIDHDGDVDVEDIKALTKEQARDLFRARFWDAYRLCSLPELVAIVVYDSMVNTGPKQAFKFLQEACNEIVPLKGIGRVTVDGVLGKQTLGAISCICSPLVPEFPHPELMLANETISARKRFYRSLVRQKPKFEAFEDGWMNRAAALTDYVFQLSKRWPR